MDTKDGQQGLPRGHSLLNGALDLSLHLTKGWDGIVRAKLTKAGYFGDSAGLHPYRYFSDSALNLGISVTVHLILPRPAEAFHLRPGN